MKRKTTVEDKEIFAKTLYNEAGSTCDFLEVLYIAWTIRNRVDRPRWWGKTYGQVCLKKWQYSCWNGWSKEKVLKLRYNSFRYTKCMVAADLVINEEKKFDPTFGATHYIEPTLVDRVPKWVKSKNVKRIFISTPLKHIFFKEK
jgi:hypothetical protein